MSYAKNTRVPAERSKAEVEKLLMRWGADHFSSAWAPKKAIIMFRMNERFIRIEMPMPTLEPATPSWDRKDGLYYSQDKVDQEIRRRWRAMILYVKAKLESVESGIVSFEEAFMAHVVMPNKQTVGQVLLPQIKSAYESGKMPPLLGYDG